MQFVGTRPEGRLVIASGAAEEAGGIAAQITGKTALLVTDQYLFRNGLDLPVRNALSRAGVKHLVFGNVATEPDEATIDGLKSAMAGHKFGIVIGLGGGSTMDAAKLAALMACGWDGEALKESAQALPTLMMPTTAGTGSEVSPFAVYTRNGEKRFLTSPLLYPAVALIDPTLSATLPPRVTAYTALDALTHGIEGACGRMNPMTLAFASECARLVFSALPRAMKCGADIAARYDLACAAVLGMMAYTQGGGLYAHSMSYLLSARAAVPHGMGCALALPSTLALNTPAVGPVLDALSRATALPRDGFLSALSALIKDCGLPQTLKEIGVQPSEIKGLSRGLINQYPRAANPVALSEETAEALVQSMYC